MNSEISLVSAEVSEASQVEILVIGDAYVLFWHANSGSSKAVYFRKIYFGKR